MYVTAYSPTGALEKKTVREGCPTKSCIIDSKTAFQMQIQMCLLPQKPHCTHYEKESLNPASRQHSGTATWLIALSLDHNKVLNVRRVDWTMAPVSKYIFLGFVPSCVFFPHTYTSSLFFLHSPNELSYIQSICWNSSVWPWIHQQQPTHPWWWRWCLSFRC